MEFPLGLYKKTVLFLKYNATFSFFHLCLLFDQEISVVHLFSSTEKPLGLTFCKSHKKIVSVKTTYDPLIKQMLGSRHRCSSPPTHKHPSPSMQTHTHTAHFPCYHLTARYHCLFLCSLSNSAALTCTSAASWKCAIAYQEDSYLFSHQNGSKSLPVLPKYWVNGAPSIGLMVSVSRGMRTQQGNLPPWDRKLAIGIS